MAERLEKSAWWRPTNCPRASQVFLECRDESGSWRASRRERPARMAGWTSEAAGINSSQLADFFKQDALQRIVKNTGIEQLANLEARAALYQHRAKKTQGVFLELKSGA